MTRSPFRLFFACFAVLLFVSLACNLPVKNASPSQTNPESVQPSEPSSPTEEESPPAPETAAPDANTPGSSPGNPAARDELHKIDGWDIQVKQYMRGDSAYQFLLKTGPANLAQVPGKDYAVILIYLRNTAMEKQYPAFLFGELFVLDDQGASYNDNFWGSPAPEIFEFDIHQGESNEGWLDIIVPHEAQHLELVIKRQSQGDNYLPRQPFYIALEP